MNFIQERGNFLNFVDHNDLTGVSGLFLKQFGTLQEAAKCLGIEQVVNASYWKLRPDQGRLACSPRPKKKHRFLF